MQKACHFRSKTSIAQVWNRRQGFANVLVKKDLELLGILSSVNTKEVR